jgi:hypothetical protein
MTHDYHDPTLDDAFAAPLSSQQLREALDMYQHLRDAGISHDVSCRLLDQITIRRAND